MKFSHLIVAIGVLTPCCLAWSSFTDSIMQSIPLNAQTFTSYTQMLFPNITQQCQSYSSIASNYPTLSPAALDWIVNTQLNYTTWCNVIQGFVDAGNATVVQYLTDSLTSFQTIGDDIDWGYNMMSTIMANNGCNQTEIDTYTASYGNNVTTTLMQTQYWSEAIGMSGQMIPPTAVSAFYNQLQFALQSPSTTSITGTTTLQQIKLVEFEFLGQTTRMYDTAVDYTVWYLEAITDTTFIGTRSSVERLVDGAVLNSRSYVC